MKRTLVTMLVAASGLTPFATFADNQAPTAAPRFYLAANVGYGTNLPDGLSDNPAVYGLTAGMPLNDIWAVESNFHYWAGSADFAMATTRTEVDLDVYAVDVAAKASYELMPNVRGFIKAGYSYLHANVTADIQDMTGILSATDSASDSTYKPVASIGLQANYGRYFTTLAYNHFFADEPYKLNAVTIGVGYTF
ncbi:outer membrane beta-barrel protein [Shewanella sp. YIC-542]|uniref:outer membrane beta-barrel protein n=1 Tax=Shewanella mytili TaxID=3377111 RepID=UPI00398F62D4